MNTKVDKLKAVLKSADLRCQSNQKSDRVPKAKAAKVLNQSLQKLLKNGIGKLPGKEPLSQYQLN